jgi:hypothetical protein
MSAVLLFDPTCPWRASCKSRRITTSNGLLRHLQRFHNLTYSGRDEWLSRLRNPADYSALGAALRATGSWLCTTWLRAADTVSTPPYPLMQGASPALGSWPGHYGTRALGPQQPPHCRGRLLHLVVGRLASPVTKVANHVAAKREQVWVPAFRGWKAC